ncbi:FAD-binding protein [Rhodovulum sp. DZ06]|uniref:FAD-binding protein n=1 Tax=Rhodovulum sp. DZ06 TaxID=3425126 RepID=UPI003D34C7FC
MRPTDEAELAEAIASATGPLEIIGGGSRAGFGRPVEGVPLETGALSGVSVYEPGALSLVAGAGTPLAEVEALIAAENQRFAFEPMDMRPLLGTSGAPTVGGMAAAGLAGPRRVQAGAVRDAMLGVRFVDGAGRVIKNGGRVMKNVTGYDLVKLLAGSHGTLGVLTEISFKLSPMPEAMATLRIDGLDDSGAVAAMSAALGSPYDVTGAAHLPGQGTFVRIEGLDGSVAYRRDRLRELLCVHGAVDDVDGDGPWADIRDVSAFAGREGAVWRLSMRPSSAPGVVARIAARRSAEVQYDWGGGLVWLLTPGAGDAGAAVIREELGAAGHATLVRAPEPVRAATPVFQPEPAPLAALSAGLRAKFDPRGILNPGRMTPAELHAGAA